MDLATELQKIYDSEINVRISWIWEAGIEVRLGDELNGFLAEEIVPCTADVLPWLQEAIAHFYSGSTYARSLPEVVKERANLRLFRPPVVGAQVALPRMRRTTRGSSRHDRADRVHVPPLRRSGQG